MNILERQRTQLVIIQPTPFCNINCRYCYLPDRLSKKRMSVETLARIFQILFSTSFISEEITFVWHAGEPLVVPVRFYEGAFSLIERFNTRGVQVTNSFQTNGTLINQHWCDFIRRQNVAIGVSIDGPEHIHDAHRVDRAGNGTFRHTMRGIEMLQRNDIDFHIIMVLTEQALDYPDEIWRFFTEHNITKLAFNAEEIEGANIRSSLQSEKAVEKYRNFFARLLELRDRHYEAVYVRELDFLIDNIKYGTHAVQSTENTPMSTLSFDCEGNVSTFSPELLTMKHAHYGDFVFGNAADGEMKDGFLSSKFKQTNFEIQKGVSKCRQSCEYFIVCGGGAPVNKLSENGTFDSAETMCCRLEVKAITDVVVNYVEQRFNALL